MSEGLSERSASCITGAIGLLGSIVYLAVARNIEDSLLADSVGASGVPIGVGVLMALASVVLLVKGWALQSPVKKLSADRQPVIKTASSDSLRPHQLAAGLLLILLLYVALLPFLGYVLSIGLLATAVAWFAGGRDRIALLAFVLLTGPLLWFLFDFALKVRMPVGTLLKFFGV
jgi:hypothetical protein